jgi:lipopolysaccharide transport protein LptA
MTNTTSLHAGHVESRGLTASARDRASAFGRARRHTLLVRLFKAALPIASVLTLVAYAASVFVTIGFRPPNFDPGTMRIDSKNLTMENPKYDGFGKDGTRYQVRAKTAVTDLKMSGPIRLNDIDGDLVQQTGVVTKLAANWGTFDQKKNVLELYEQINIDGSTGMKARLSRATVHTKDNRVVSTEPVVADMPTGSVRAKTMDLDAKSRRVTFKDAVEVRMKPNPAAKSNPEAQAAKAKSSPLPGLAVNSNVPVDVFSDRLDVDDNAKIAAFRDNVVAKQADATLRAPELDVIYEGKAALPTGAPSSTGTEGDATRIKFLKARGGVTMTQKEDRATGETLDYEAAGEHITLRGNVVLVSSNDRNATSDMAEFFGTADTALLTGNVVVTQNKNILKGQRLFLDRKAGRTKLEAPSEPGKPSGRIAATFYQPEKPGTDASAKSAKTPEAKADSASSVLPLGTAFKTDPKAPIDVDAETLEVFDQNRMAVFKGGVIAKQGDFVVRSVEMTARYTGQAGLDLSSASAKSDGQKGAQLTKIEARQKVVISSTDGRTASGDWADFDVKSNTAVLGGKVIVSQGKSIVEGTKLLIDMNTGQSRFETPADGNKGNAAATAEASPACPEGQICSKQRVRAVFYPKEVEAAQKKKKPEAAKDGADRSPGSAPAKQPSSSSWQSTTQPRTQ